MADSTARLAGAADAECPPTPAARPLVSVIVPCRNERRYIAKCLQSILATKYPQDRLDILVADGMSDDGTRDLLVEQARHHRAIRVIDNPSGTTPAGLNAAIRAARGDIIIRMDAHTEYPPTYIPALVEWLERTGADNVGGAWIIGPGNRSSQARAIAYALAHPFGVGNARYRLGPATQLMRVDTVPFGCFRRDVFDRVGGFDEELPRNQDDEFNLRLIRAGGAVLLVPGVVSYYYARDSIRKLAQAYFQYGLYKPLVARKVGRIMTLCQLMPPLLVLSLAATALGSVWGSAPRLAFLVLATGYAGATTLCAAAGARRSGARVGLALLAVFPALHLSYGLGFLVGAARLLSGRRPHAAPASTLPLTR